MLIAGLSGSLRQGSYNTALLRTAGTLLPAGVKLHLFGGLHAVPPYDEDADGDTPPRRSPRCVTRSSRPTLC